MPGWSMRARARSRRRAGSRSSVQGVPARQPDLKEERKGPRVGAPEGAIAGFLKAAGLASIDEATIQKDPKKGDFYVALTEKPGRAAIDVIGEIAARSCCAPSRGRSRCAGARSRRRPAASNGCARCTRSSRPSGPRPRSPRSCRSRSTASRPATPPTATASSRPARSRCATSTTMWRSSRRPRSCSIRRGASEIILNDAKNLAFAQGFELVEDEGLLNEVAGLVEWPVVLMGTFDEAFLKIPDEVIRATIRNNQKCFVLRDPKTGRLANRFILTANTEAADGGKAIIAGNERVIRARLSDAKFFYETDLKTRLEDRLPKLQGHHLPREARHPGRAHRAHRETRRRARAAGRRRCREGEARRAARQGRPAHRSGRRIPRGAGH